MTGYDVNIKIHKIKDFYDLIPKSRLFLILKHWIAIKIKVYVYYKKFGRWS